MTNKIHKYLLLVVVAFCVSLFSNCEKDAAPPTDTPPHPWHPSIFTATINGQPFSASSFYVCNNCAPPPFVDYFIWGKDLSTGEVIVLDLKNISPGIYTLDGGPAESGSGGYAIAGDSAWGWSTDSMHIGTLLLQEWSYQRNQANRWHIVGDFNFLAVKYVTWDTLGNLSDTVRVKGSFDIWYP